MRRNLAGLAVFLLLAGGITLGLTVLNRVPLYAEKGVVRQYGSIDEAGRALGMKEVLAPAYYPEGLGWPPTAVFAQGKPFRAILMEFGDGAGGDPSLVISESESGSFPPGRLRFESVTERTDYGLKGRKAVLEVGRSTDGSELSRVTWSERGKTVVVTAKYPPFELLRTAESMLR